MEVSKWLRLGVIVGGLAAVPLSMDVSTGQVVMNEVGCQSIPGEGEAGGTCCPETSGWCYPNDCSQQSCATDRHWWRSDGKKCSDPR
jgi:hypothetical protein